MIHIITQLQYNQNMIQYYAYEKTVLSIFLNENL